MRLVVVCVVFTLAAAGIGWAGGLFGPAPVLRAAVRAALQLAVVSVVITAVLAALPLTAAFLALMAAVATGTSAARSKTGRRGIWVGLAILAGTVPALALMLLTGLVPPTGLALVPTGGILVGGAMTATTLATRRALDTLHDRHGEFEAALALGFTEPVAVRELVRPTAADALLPALDQTRTVGIVTLPGAFVGMLLGGAPVWQAGALQLVVLLALLAVEAAAIVVVVELVARGLVRRARV
ncbi:ABC transporter permease [Solihabitans fulvus]|uniref:ABC transporter permease n=1 Tax=Solihabitans fulvus TaxID=1892852 RepID=A0A5B2XJU2_9PSEU|nr:ABC transporter permease [Solihabitans fulvus]